MERILNADMREYTSFKAGGRTKELVIVYSTEELKSIIKELKEKGEKYTLIGNGSNTLVTDRGFNGTIVKLGGSVFTSIDIDGDILTAGSAALMSVVAKAAGAEGLTGFEFASGIPGSIGGAAFMNAGAYGGEMKDIIKSVKIVRADGSQMMEIPAAQLDLSYRHSSLPVTGDIVVAVTLKLAKGDTKEIAARMEELTKKRNEKQPVQYPSAGSFFKRPEGYFAGKLIEDSGCKGLTVGGAQISEKHSGFMINTGNATATDIIELMHLVQNTVYDKFQVSLEPEVRIIGD